MGVDFYTCSSCSFIFPDCGEYYTCNQCEKCFCDSKCARSKLVSNDNEDYSNCLFCRKEDANDSILCEVMMKHFNVTREQVLEIWRNQE